MPKYYFDKNGFGECCYTLDYFKDERLESGRDIILEEAEREYGNGLFFCRVTEECGEVGEGCGDDCNEYQPRNGKNGRCRFSGNTFNGTGKLFKLTKENKLIRIERKSEIEEGS